MNMMNENLDFQLIEQFQQQCLLIEWLVNNMSENDFMADIRTKNAVAMSLIVLGEISNNINKINPLFTKQYKQIPWRIMIDMRNRIAHDYYGLDWNIVYKTAKIEIPKLIQTIQAIQEIK